mmetsp:Transcript_42134/g.69447  ORF Transcript_42134/g.69447 Transcript_42134/m.69447 type:complete len:204 (+) Transcript_42134:737-1348(+)
MRLRQQLVLGIAHRVRHRRYIMRSTLRLIRCGIHFNHHRLAGRSRTRFRWQLYSLLLFVVEFVVFLLLWWDCVTCIATLHQFLLHMIANFFMHDNIDGDEMHALIHVERQSWFNILLNLGFHNCKNIRLRIIICSGGVSDLYNFAFSILVIVHRKMIIIRHVHILIFTHNITTLVYTLLLKDNICVHQLDCLMQYFLRELYAI